jgi:D-sedoheptulose 7-phosphate isomerase
MQPATLPTVVPVPPPSDLDADFGAAIGAALADRETRLGTALRRMRGQVSALSDAATRIVDSLRTGGHVLVAGNGGSAAEAQHLAAEFVGRFLREREAYPAIALTADTATLTALANDYGYEEVFVRQVAAHGRRGDVFVAFSTSGESENLVRAAQSAVERGIAVVAITGGQPNRLAACADVAIQVPLVETPLTQELHAVVLHVLCDVVESALCALA